MPSPGLERLLLVTLVSVASVACGRPEPVDDVAVGEAAPPELAPVASLASAPSLQALVDAQIGRDAAPLLEGLKSDEEAVAVRAALGLTSLQYRNGMAALEVRLQDSRASVRARAAVALGLSGAGEEADALLGALAAEEDPAVRLELIRGAGFAAEARHWEALTDAARSGQELAAVALAVSRTGIRDTVEEGMLAWLVTHLTHEDPEVRLASAYYFARAPEAGSWAAGAEGVREALATLDPRDDAVRFLLPGLAALGDVDDTPIFARWTRASLDWRTRAAAVMALRDRLGDRTARGAVLAALDDPSPHVSEASASELARSRPALQAVRDELVDWIGAHPEKWQAAALLWSGMAPLGVEEAIPVWLEGLPADNVLARAAGIEALSRVPGTAHLDQLFSFAMDEDDRIAAAAYRGLAAHWGNRRDDEGLVDRFDETFRVGLGRSHPTVVGMAARGLTDPLLLGRGSAGALEGALLGRDPTDPGDAAAAAAIVRALAQTRDTTWVPLMERYLQHPQQAVRSAAAEGIESLTLRRPPAVGADPAVEPALAIDWDAFPRSRPVVRMETDKGTVRMELAHEEAPLTVQTFLRLVESGAYDGVPFHRVVPNFVVQGGDVGRLDGTGGPGFSIRTELTAVPFRRGALGMASAGRDTEGSQFFIMHTWAPHLEGRYTSFGWVTSGMDVVDGLLRGDRIVRMVRES